MASQRVRHDWVTFTSNNWDMPYLGHIYSKKIFTVFLKFKFHWTFCILSGNPSHEDHRKHTPGSLKPQREHPQAPGCERGRFNNQVAMSDQLLPGLHCLLQAGIPLSNAPAPPRGKATWSFWLWDNHALWQSALSLWESVPALKRVWSMIFMRAECSLPDLGNITIYKLNCCASSDSSTLVTSAHTREQRRGLQRPSLRGTCPLPKPSHWDLLRVAQS